MSKAKWFCGKEASAGEIIATSAKLSQPDCATEIPAEVQKCCTIFIRPPFPLGGLKGGLEMRLVLSMMEIMSY